MSKLAISFLAGILVYKILASIIGNDTKNLIDLMNDDQIVDTLPPETCLESLATMPKKLD